MKYYIIFTIYFSIVNIIVFRSDIYFKQNSKQHTHYAYKNNSLFGKTKRNYKNCIAP